MKTHLKILAALLAAFILFACAAATKTELFTEEEKVIDLKPGTPLGPIEKSEEDRQVLLAVNGDRVTLNEFREDYEYYLAQNPGIRASKENEKAFMDQYIKDIVVAQRASKVKLDKDAGYKIKKRNKERRMLIDYYFHSLEQMGAISEGDIQRYYREHLDEFTEPEMIKVSIITNNNIEKIQDAQMRLKKGENFADVAVALSIHPSRETGGAMKEYFRRGEKNPEFEKYAFALSVSQVSEVFQIDSVYYILKVTGRREKTVKTLDEVRENIRKKILDEKKSTVLDNLMFNSVIIVDESLLK